MQSARAQLQKARQGKVKLTPEQTAELARQAVENDVLNSDIWREFNYFKKHGKPLAKHPIFTEYNLSEKIKMMSGPEKLKRFNSLEKDISREYRNLDKAKATKNFEMTEKIKARLKVKEAELKLIKKLTL